MRTQLLRFDHIDPDGFKFAPGFFRFNRVVTVYQDFDRMKPIGVCTVTEEADGLYMHPGTLREKVAGQIPGAMFSILADGKAPGEVKSATLYGVGVSSRPNKDPEIEAIKKLPTKEDFEMKLLGIPSFMGGSGKDFNSEGTVWHRLKEIVREDDKFVYPSAGKFFAEPTGNFTSGGRLSGDGKDEKDKPIQL